MTGEHEDLLDEIRETRDRVDREAQKLRRLMDDYNRPRREVNELEAKVERQT